MCVCVWISEFCFKICGNNNYLNVVYAVLCFCKHSAEHLNQDSPRQTETVAVLDAVISY
jgi:hypothetical protein